MGQPWDEVDAGPGRGTTYIIDLEKESSSNFDDVGHYLLHGVRLPDLAGHAEGGAGDDDPIVALELGESLEEQVRRALGRVDGAHAVSSRCDDDSNVFVFDDLWAAAYPDLAESLLHYVASWDPFEDVDD